MSCRTYVTLPVPRLRTPHSVPCYCLTQSASWCHVPQGIHMSLLLATKLIHPFKPRGFSFLPKSMLLMGDELQKHKIILSSTSCNFCKVAVELQSPALRELDFRGAKRDAKAAIMAVALRIAIIRRIGYKFLTTVGILCKILVQRSAFRVLWSRDSSYTCPFLKPLLNYGN